MRSLLCMILFIAFNFAFGQNKSIKIQDLKKCLKEGQTSFNSGIYYLNSPYTIPAGVTLNFNNIEVRCGSDVVITQSNNSTFNVNNSWIHSCDNVMWVGIRATQINSNLRILYF